jgi:cytochrome oxidase assembly protein ShyY1
VAGSPAAFPPPTGEVTVSGSLPPPEPGADPGPEPPAGQIRAADTADLVNRWGGPIYNVLVYDAVGDPGSVGATRLVPVPPPPVDQGGGLGLRNAAYAVQWWLFGVFALLLWWKMVRQDAREAAADEPADESAQDQPQDNRPKELSSP